ncbi:MAG: hypothetical protein ACXWV0_01595 [Flavisolibacter sp.]
MNQEYITTAGKVIVERDILYVRTQKNHFTQTIFFDFLPLVLMVLPILHFVYFENNPRWYLRMFLYLSIFFMYGGNLYYVIFKKSFANRIPIQRIKMFDIKPDETASGLETKVQLHLSSGRIKTIVFRTREHQWEPFTEYLSSHVQSTQLAH